MEVENQHIVAGNLILHCYAWAINLTPEVLLFQLLNYLKQIQGKEYILNAQISRAWVFLLIMEEDIRNNHKFSYWLSDVSTEHRCSDQFTLLT